MDKRLEVAISFLETIKNSKTLDADLLKIVANEALDQIEMLTDYLERGDNENTRGTTQCLYEIQRKGL